MTGTVRILALLLFFALLAGLMLVLASCRGENGESEAARAQVQGQGSGETTASSISSADTFEHAELRRAMVRRQIEARGVKDRSVLEAMQTVPRHRFVPSASPSLAYSDQPLPIGHGQTISQPYIVAFMAAAAEVGPRDRVLEIGTGSGYGAAVLGEMALEVYTIEIIPELAERARRVLREIGCDNVHVRTGNGWLGWPEHAPYDAVVVTAAPDEIPTALREQLSVGGTMVIPVGSLFQTLRVLRKTPEGLEEVATMPVRFVPMVGEPVDTGDLENGASPSEPDGNRPGGPDETTREGPDRSMQSRD